MCYKPIYSLFLLLLLSACGKDLSVAKKKVPEYTGATAEFDSIRTIYSQNATMRIKLYGVRQIVLQNGDIMYPKGLEVNMYNEQGVRTTNLRADSGRYEKNIRIYRAYGNIVVVNLEQQQTVYTDQLNWDQNKREIFTEDSIKIVTPNELLYGIGMVSNDEFSKYKITKPTGVFAIEETPKAKKNTQ